MFALSAFHTTTIHVPDGRFKRKPHSTNHFERNCVNLFIQNHLCCRLFIISATFQQIEFQLDEFFIYCYFLSLSIKTITRQFSFPPKWYIVTS